MQKKEVAKTKVHRIAGLQREHYEVTPTEPWDQQKNEPDIWYRRFTTYRLIGPRRSVQRAWIMEKSLTQAIDKYANNSNGAWTLKAREWSWKERATAWDDHNLAMMAEEADKVLKEGTALMYKRVEKLKELGGRLEEVLLDPDNHKLSSYLIEQYRGVLDDIAREMGERTKETRLTGPNGGPVEITTSWGRGGSATNAWTALPEPIIETVVEEVTENSSVE